MIFYTFASSRQRRVNVLIRSSIILIDDDREHEGRKKTFDIIHNHERKALLLYQL